MTKQEQRAYENGRRIAEHVISRIGETGAMERGGYWDVLLGL